MKEEKRAVKGGRRLSAAEGRRGSGSAGFSGAEGSCVVEEDSASGLGGSGGSGDGCGGVPSGDDSGDLGAGSGSDSSWARILS